MDDERETRRYAEILMVASLAATCGHGAAITQEVHAGVQGSRSAANADGRADGGGGAGM
jgi:hypothetical protein